MIYDVTQARGDNDDVTVIIMSLPVKDFNDVTEVGRGEKEEKEGLL